MHTLLQDLRFSIRLLWKKAGFTAIVVLALALGIGANSAIFSVINGVLLRQLPFLEPDRLVQVWERRPQQNRDSNPVAPADYIDWQAQNRSFEDMAAYSFVALTLTGESEAERFYGAEVTISFFKVLGVDARHGRVFNPELDRAGGERVAVISYGLWQRRFGSDRGIIGRSIALNGDNFTVVGIMPEAFRYPTEVANIDFWVSPQRALPGANLPNNPDEAKIRGLHYLFVIARLQPGVTIEQAQSELDAIAGHLEKQYADTNTGHGVRLVNLHHQQVGSVKTALLVLAGAVGFVLLIACANIANLQLARAAARQREIAIRSALGAQTRDVMRMVLRQGLTLAFIGIVIGLIAAVALTRAMASLLYGVSSIDPVTFITISLFLLAVVAFACYIPARRATTIDPMIALRCD